MITEFKPFGSTPLNYPLLDYIPLLLILFGYVLGPVSEKQLNTITTQEHLKIRVISVRLFGS